MITKSACLLPLLLTLSACSPKDDQQQHLSEAGFDILCEHFAKLTQAKDYQTLSSEERGAKLESMLAKSLEPATEAYMTWTAVRNAPPTERYHLYKEAATSTGYTNWTCPAIEHQAHEVGSMHN